jgi:hypothetical protein
MGIESFNGGDAAEQEAASFRFNRYESRVGEADSVDNSFGKFDDAGFQCVAPEKLPDQRGSGTPYEYDGLAPEEMQAEFQRFYAMDQGAMAWDSSTHDAFYGDRGVTVVQDGGMVDVSRGHERLRYAQETNQPYLPVHVFKTRY